MATEKGIKFYSNAYGATSANALSTTQEGSIVFDKTSKSIFVNGVRYGGGLKDAAFANNVLKIWKADDADATPSISLDFSSLATTKSVMAVFNEIANQITLTTTAGQYIDTDDAKYFSASAVQSFNTDNVIAVGESGDTAQSAIGKLDNKVKTLVSEIVDNEEVTTEAFANVKTSVGLNNDMSISFTNDLIKDQTSAKGAIEKIATSLSEAGKVDDVQVNGTTIVTNKIANLNVDGDQSSTNKIATQSTVSTAIDAIAGAGLAVDANGAVTATTQTAGDNTTNVATTAFVKTAVDNAIDGLDYNTAAAANLATVSGNVITLATTIKEENGVIAVSGTQALAAVAKTGAAGDVTIADANNKITATTVEGALEELADAISGNEVSVAGGEKIISMSDNNELSSTLTIDIQKGSDNKEYIVLKGIDNAEVSKVDASAFVKDGMIDSVAWDEDNANTLVITWNTDAGKAATEVDMSKFIDTYTSGNQTALTVNDYTITPNTGAVAENAGTLTTGGQVYTAINNALKGYAKSIKVGDDVYNVTTDGTDITLPSLTASPDYGTETMDAAVITALNTTNKISTTDNYSEGIAKLDNKSKVIVDEIILNEKATASAFSAVQEAVGLDANLAYVKQTSTNYIKEATSVNDADAKLDAAIKSVSDKVDKAGKVDDVKVGEVSVLNADKEAVIAVDGTYNAESNKVATQSTVTTAIENIAEATESKTNSGITVGVTTEAGSVSSVDVAVTAATVTYTEKSEGVDINLAANDGDLVLKGNSITAIKNYIDAMVAAKVASVTNAGATIPVNGTTATKIAEVDGTDINAKVSFVWEEYE